MEETAYEQCLNCIHKNWRFLGLLKCTTEGLRSIRKLKKQQHCASQYQITKFPKRYSK